MGPQARTRKLSPRHAESAEAPQGDGGAASIGVAAAELSTRACILALAPSFLVDSRLPRCFIVRVGRYDHLNATAGALEQRSREWVLSAITEPLAHSHDLY